MHASIIIRVDASPEIGFGHISRCLVLAKALEFNFKITFVSKLMPRVFIKNILNSGFKFLQINNDDFSIFNKCIVVIDGYNFNSIYQKKVKLVAAKLVCIDELRDIQYHADVIINNQPCLKVKDFLCKESTEIYSGLQFSMLRNEFIAVGKEMVKHKKLKDKKTFFICFGGSDPNNFSEKIVKMLLQKDSSYCVNLLLGSGYKHDSNFDANNVNIFKSLNPDELIQVIKKSNIAILPASTIMLEAFCVGIPIISGWYSNKQKQTLECLHKDGYILNCGDYRERFKNEMFRLIDSITDENSYGFVEKQRSINFGNDFLNKIFIKDAT